MPAETPRRSARPTKKELEAQVAQLAAALQRERADADNLRRRGAASRDRDRRAVRRETVVKLLPVIDSLGRAFAQPPADLADNQWVRGALGIGRQLGGMLAELGLAQIETVGQPFDPDLMEAVEAVPTAEQPAQTVITEVVPGYWLNDELLRAAQVRVAVAPQDDPGGK